MILEGSLVVKQWLQPEVGLAQVSWKGHSPDTSTSSLRSSYQQEFKN